MSTRKPTATTTDYLCPVKALEQCFLHLCLHGDTRKTFLSSYGTKGTKADVTAENISRALKSATMELHYHTIKGIPISRVNTHSLHSGGSNAHALAGYLDTQIQKMGQWCGATFKEYIRKELVCYASGMSYDMKQKSNFINIVRKAFTKINNKTLHVIEFDK